MQSSDAGAPVEELIVVVTDDSLYSLSPLRWSATRIAASTPALAGIAFGGSNLTTLYGISAASRKVGTMSRTTGVWTNMHPGIPSTVSVPAADLPSGYTASDWLHGFQWFNGKLYVMTALNLYDIALTTGHGNAVAAAQSNWGHASTLVPVGMVVLASDLMAVTQVADNATKAILWSLVNAGTVENAVQDSGAARTIYLRNTQGASQMSHFRKGGWFAWGGRLHGVNEQVFDPYSVWRAGTE